MIALPSLAHELGEDCDAAESLGSQPEELLATRVADHIEMWGEVARARIQRLVHLAAKLVAHEAVGDGRRADHGDGHGCGGGQRQARAEAHVASRSA